MRAIIERVVRTTAEFMTLPKQLLIVGAGFLLIGAIEVLSHWLLAQPLFRIPRLVYSLHTPSGGMMIFPDFLLPVLVLSWWNSWVGRKLAPGRVLALGLPLALGIVALIPLYAKLMMADKEAIWWWPNDAILRYLNLAILLFFATVSVLGSVRFYHKDFPRLTR